MGMSNARRRYSAQLAFHKHFGQRQPKPTPPCHRLPSSAIGLYSERFHGLLTLSPEFFSTFPYGTCSLSVLWIYLALDRVYDLLSAACASNATHREKGLTLAQQIARVHTGLSPSTTPQSLLSSGTPLVAGLSDRVAVGF